MNFLRWVLLWNILLMVGIAVSRAQTSPSTATRKSYSPALVKSGEVLFQQNCAFCHGRDAAGGETGPDLTRSKLVAKDVGGDKIGVVVHNGRPDKGMPHFDFSDQQLAGLTAFIHTQRNNALKQTGGRKGVDVSDLQTGNIAAGKQYFNGAGGCASCHSPTGDLAGIATRYQGLDLEQKMLYPEDVKSNVAVTLPSGQTITGTLAYLDEFTVGLIDPTGVYQSWRIRDVKYKVDDPVDAHVKLFSKYTDDDIHNLMAYLQTLHGSGQERAHPSSASYRSGTSNQDNATANADSFAKMLLHPPADSWPGYHGDYSGRRHSSLTQIDPKNVKYLGLAWVFQTDQKEAIKSSPLLVNGILYFTVPDNIWAIDARSGHQIWHYVYPPNRGLHIGQRGVGMYKGYLFFMSPDAHLVSLNAKDGTVRWIVPVADATKGYWASMAPLIVGNHVLIGVSGDFDNLRGFIRSVDPETGATQWQWNSTPPPGTPNQTTGGMTWMTGTYDPVLNLVYWGTGNPSPVLNGSSRPGDDLYTCSIVAINPDTGKLVWHFQVSPHDTHDWDAVETPVLVDGQFHGKPVKMLMQASRNGYFFVLDRTNGKSLLTAPFGPVNWSLGVDKQGRPIPNPAKEPAPDGRLIAPDEGGLTNFRAPSFDSRNGLFVVDASPSYSLYFAKPADGLYGWAGADNSLWSTGVIEAIDYQTGKIRWSHPTGPGGSAAGVLTTDSGLTFTGDARGNFLALDSRNGKTLWHAGSGAWIESSPITYELDGRQYVLEGSGGVMFAWTLPKTP